MRVQVTFNNRAMVYLKLQQPQLAITDCTQSLQIGWSAKAAYRHGTAAIALGLYRDALRSFQSVLMRDPRNREALSKVQECEEALQRSHGGDGDEVQMAVDEFML
jgi:tetratricopeptide (TPR) repeat protein